MQPCKIAVLLNVFPTLTSGGTSSELQLAVGHLARFTTIYHVVWTTSFFSDASTINRRAGFVNGFHQTFLRLTPNLFTLNSAVPQAVVVDAPTVFLGELQAMMHK